MPSDKLLEVVDEINSDSDAIQIGKARRNAGFNPVQYPSRLLMLDVAMDGGIPRGKMLRIFGNESTGKTTTLYKFYSASQRTCRNCNEPLDVEDITQYEVFDKLEDKTLYLTEDYIEGNEAFEDKGIEFPNYSDDGEKQDDIEIIKQAITNELGKNVKRYDITPYRKIKINDCTLCDNPEPMNCVHLDAERDWDNDWADACGIDTEEILVTQVLSTEESIDEVTKLLKTGEVDFLGLDSWAALTPQKELSNESQDGDDNTMGDQAKLANKALRKWISTLASEGIDQRNRPTIAVLNQYRIDINTNFGDPRTTPGGKGQNFASSLDIEMLSSDEYSESGEMGKKDKKIYKKDLQFNIKKNKQDPEGRRGYYTIYTREHNGHKPGEVNDKNNVLDFARDLKILEKDGNDYIWEAEGLEKGTLTELKETIADDPELYQNIRQQVVELL
jgi:RecA/RadA recombinase